MKTYFLKNSRAGFTLVELIISIGIIAALSTVAVLTINPNQKFKEARDAGRITDVQSLNNALLHYQVAGGTNLGSTNTIYISLPSAQSNCSDLSLPTPPVGWSYACKPAGSYRNMNGTGWIPVNFTIAQSSIGTLFSALPIDPLNTLVGDFYYTYIHDVNWAVSATMESTKSLTNVAPYDGGSSNTRAEAGKDIYLNSNLDIVIPIGTMTTYAVTGAMPNGITFDGTNIWTANRTGNSVTKIAPNGTAMGTYGPTGTGPNGITFDGTNIWTANATGNNITKFALDGTVIGTYGTTGSIPEDIIFDGTNIWTANATGGVTKFAQNGTFLGTYTSSFGDNRSIAFDGTNLWAANYSFSNVTKFTPSGSVIGTYGPTGLYPYDIVFDGTYIWTANSIGNSVTKFALNGTVIGTYGPTGTSPRSIAFDGNNIWTANWSGNSVTEFAQNGTIIGTYSTTGTNPKSIVFDGTNMWTANSGANSVTKIRAK